VKTYVGRVFGPGKRPDVGRVFRPGDAADAGRVSGPGYTDRRSGDPPSAGSRALSVRRLGRVAYAGALTLQAELVEDRRAGRIGDTLLLLEHPPVITLGVKTRRGPTHIVASADRLAGMGVTVHETGRGGDVTYHGPGQLVGYPIVDLRPDRCDVHRYVRDLEEVLIRAAAAFGVEARRVPGLTGVWAGPEDREEKLAAIGVRISRWITSHGFALNVAPDLSHFNLIVPCGIVDRRVTSLERLLGRAVPMRDVEDTVAESFATVFDRTEVDHPGSDSARAWP
jgi:lipoyl(octanoyl) transferase